MSSRAEMARQVRVYLDRVCPDWRAIYVREFRERAVAEGRSQQWGSIRLRLAAADGTEVDLVLLANGGIEGEADPDGEPGDWPPPGE